MATGTTTSTQWTAAQTAAYNAAIAADKAAFDADQKVVDARADVYRANLAIETATTQNNPTAIAAAKAQLVAAQNSIITRQASATQVRQQAENAGVAYEAAQSEAEKNAGAPGAVTPAPATTAATEPTAYVPTPTITPVTSPTAKPENTFSASTATTATVTVTKSVAVETTTGGSSTTTTSTPAVATEKSTALQLQADASQKQADLLSLNPNTAFGKRALDRKLAEGTITQTDYDYAKGLSNEDRLAAKSVALSKTIDLQTQANSATDQPPPTSTTTPSLNTTEVTVTNSKVVSVDQATTINGEISGYNVSTEEVEGVTYQVTSNPDGSKSYSTPSDNITDAEPAQEISTTVDDSYVVPEDTQPYSPLQEPPGVTGDEFDGIDQQVADNENGLQEPPQLSDEEVDAYLQQSGEPTQDEEPVDAVPTTNATGTTRSLPPVTVTAKKSLFTADDWRVRLSLADTANYLYKIAEKTDIMYPLVATDGVVFPYTPVINTAYRANYDPSELTHSNYKMFFYKNSSVDDISITADFTAQDTAEANYMLAVIHFFKSATKMFYGQDTAPRAGTPPPLLYLNGYGHHQFENHPLLLTNFTYNLPNDVDYIRAGSNATWGGVDIAKMSTRLAASGLQPGGVAKPAAFSGLASKDVVTYLPTKIQITLGLVPVVTRNDISKNFSLKDYAAGKLSGKTGGGIW